MDEKDASILRVIGRRSGLSRRALSKMLDIPIATAHRRIKRLEREGIIKGYKALINYEKTSWPNGALLLIDLEEVTPGRGHFPKVTILNSLRSFNEVEEIIEVQAANFDLMIKARFRSLRKLSQFIEELRGVEGIEETSPAVITEETTVERDV